MGFDDSTEDTPTFDPTEDIQILTARQRLLMLGYQ
jgi:hypothetical protein